VHIRKPMKMPYLGKMDLRWCTACNVPVLAKLCGACGGETKKVKVTPPGDVRPALEGDIKLINETLQGQFGCQLIPEDKVAVLNKAPGQDRFDEVIVDGVVIGVLKFDVKKLDFEFLPRLEGARRIWKVSRRKFIEVHESAKPFILKGASVLMPGVAGFDEGIVEDEEVIVTSGGEVIAVGRSRFSAEEAREREKGMFAKVRRYGPPKEAEVLPGGQDWNKVLEANRKVIEAHEREAIEFIKKVSDTDLPKVVAFSGGKDSLATLLLVRKVLPDVQAIFIDTGLEFPEIVEYTKAIVEKLGIRLLSTSSGNFWEGVEYFGPPGRDYRWCCKVCKLGPTARLISERFPGGCLSFIGQRRYESEVRARSKRVWRNPWIPIQLGASPIQHWTALHVWLYLIREDVEVNELYSKGMERLGCWPCPSSDIAELRVLKRIHPELWWNWERALRSSGLSKGEIEHGFWRWHNLGEGQKKLAGELGIDIHERIRNRKFDFERAANMAKILGDVRIMEDCFEIDGARVYRDGQVDGDGEVLGVIERASQCLGCGTCLSQCKSGVIEIKDNKAWIGEGCTGCMRCHRRCPVVRYGIRGA
jgi:phosphoadenosine phosphosulfate reductase